MSVVLKPFWWSPNGHTTVWQEIGKLAEYGAHEIGLLAEGFIGHEAPKKLAAPDMPSVPAPAPATPEPAPESEPVVTPAPAAPAAKAKTAAK